MGKAAGTSAESYIMEQIDELHNKGESLRRRLAELEELISSSTRSEIEFDLLAQMLATFKSTVDQMTVEQKRAAIRTIVKQVIWDGKNAHLVLFGSNYKYEFPEKPIGIRNKIANNVEKENFDEAAERGDVEPLGEYSIFDTPRRICRQPNLLFRLVAGNSLDKPNGPDGNQIILVNTLGVILL